MPRIVSFANFVAERGARHRRSSSWTAGRTSTSTPTPTPTTVTTNAANAGMVLTPHRARTGAAASATATTTTAMAMGTATVALLVLSVLFGFTAVTVRGDTIAQLTTKYPKCGTTDGISCLYDDDICGECSATGQVYRCNQPGTVHLTIDDGPFDNTPTTLDVLKAKQVPVTFFIVGQQVPGREDMLTRMVAEGHNIASHSQTHPHLNSITDAATLSTEVDTTCIASIKAALPSAVITHYRPPFGECNNKCVAEMQGAGLTGTYWSTDSNDWQINETLLRNGIDAMPAASASTAGEVILMHCGSPGEIDNFGLCYLSTIVDRLRYKGWNFVTADQCWGTASKSAIPYQGPVVTTNPAWPTCTSASVVTVPSPCSPNNGGCDANANCVADASGQSRTCTCKSGFTGDGLTCTDNNECVTNNGGCADTATCTNTAGSFTCTCRAGFTGSGTSCTNTNECATSNGGCDTLTTCTDATPNDADWTVKYTCGACPAGYTGSGATSCVDINECATNNGGCSLSPKIACTNKSPLASNSWTTHMCGSCPSGYTTTDGVTCVDINECAVSNGGCTTSNGKCNNEAGTFWCSCNAGFHGDALAGAGDMGCVDTNECATSNGGCDAAAVCSNLVGSNTCACRAGFTGNGVNCTNVNECRLPVSQGGCDTSATCTDLTPSASDWTARVNCGACVSGTTGTGLTGCVNVNECATANGGCVEGAACIDAKPTPSAPATHGCGGCLSGWSGDGTVCTDINECAASTSPCAATATACVNTKGSYNCTCAAGQVGDGRASGTGCDWDDCASNPCQNGATCLDKTAHFECVCADGFEGTTCADTPETAAERSARVATIVVPCVVGGIGAIACAAFAVRRYRGLKPDGSAAAGAGVVGAAPIVSLPASAAPAAATAASTPAVTPRGMTGTTGMTGMTGIADGTGADGIGAVKVDVNAGTDHRGLRARSPPPTRSFPIP